MKASLYASFPLLVMLLFGAAPLDAQASAQNPAPAPAAVDGIVAVVGDSIVLRTDIQEELLRRSLAGQEVPEDPVLLERLQREILDRRIEELLLLQAAARDSVQVTAEEINPLVDQEIERRRSEFPNATAFEAALRQNGLTLDEYRETLAGQLRRNAMIQRYVSLASSERQPPPVSEQEIREFFEARREQLGDRPATIAFEQVVVATTPTDSARAKARAEAEEVLGLLREGEEFDLLARRYSDDPGTRERGGDLGWFRRGDMAINFENAVFALRPGAVSPIVETSFGFHIIRLDKIRDNERSARHILIQPEISDADVARARAVAEDVAERVRAGGEIDDLADEYNDPAERTRVGPLPRDQLPAPYNTALAEVTPGTVVGPIRLSDPVADKWAVVKVTQAAEAGTYTLDDVRTQIKQQLERQKLIDEVVAELRTRTYIDIRL